MLVNSPRCRVGPIGLGHFECKPSPTEELVKERFFFWWVAYSTWPMSKSFPRTIKAKLASLLHTTHLWWEMPHKDPEWRHEMELDPQVCTLQELCPGTHAQVPSQKRAEPGCKLRPCQLLDSKLAGANKAKAMSQPASLMLGMSPVRLPFCEGKTVPSEPSQKFLNKQKMDRKKQLGNIKFWCTSIYKHRGMHVLKCRFSEMSPKGQFRHAHNLRLGKKSHLVTK
jgi:hypothetical protein